MELKFKSLTFGENLLHCNVNKTLDVKNILTEFCIAVGGRS